jgi:hypothetical protein
MPKCCGNFPEPRHTASLNMKRRNGEGFERQQATLPPPPPTRHSPSTSFLYSSRPYSPPCIRMNLQQNYTYPYCKGFCNSHHSHLKYCHEFIVMVSCYGMEKRLWVAFVVVNWDFTRNSIGGKYEVERSSSRDAVTAVNRSLVQHRTY